MISASTRKAVAALLAVDPTATEPERELVAAALAGNATIGRPAPTPAVAGEVAAPSRALFSLGDAAKILSRSKATVRRLCKIGVLTPVCGSGPRQFVTSVTAESVKRYVTGKGVANV